MKSTAEALFTPELLQQYAIKDGESGLDNILENNGGKLPTGGLISVKSSRAEKKGSHSSEKKQGKDGHKSEKKRGKDDHNHKSSKKKRT